MTTTPDPAGAPPVLPGAVSRDAEGWVVASPPKAVEVVQRIVTFPRTIWFHRDLIVTSVKRELRARFMGTVLGLAWPLIAPLFLFAAYYFIFTNLLQVKFGELDEAQKSAMGVFMFVGIIVWAAIAEGLIRACNVITENGNIIKKLVFPAEILPLNVVLVNTVTMLFGLAMFVLGTTFTSVWEAVNPVDLLWIPVLLLLQVLFCYGLGLFLAALQVFLRDTLQVLTVVVTVWMFVTPVFWTPELIMAPEIHAANEAGLTIGPEDTKIWPYMGLIEGNPTYHLVYAWRWVLMDQEPAMIFGDSVMPHTMGAAVGTFAVWAVGAFVLGYAFFILCQRRFADEV